MFSPLGKPTKADFQSRVTEVAYPFGPACADIAGGFDYNLDRGPGIGDARDILPGELRVPYLGLDSTDAVMLQSRGYSQYHAGQLNVSKRLSKIYGLNYSLRSW